RKVFPEVISRIANGTCLSACLKQHALDWETFYRHLRQSPEAREAYARASESGVEKWVDEIVEMSDEAIGEPQEVVTAVRNAVDVRKWLAGKLMPRQYGDTPSQLITVNTANTVMVISQEKLRELQETRRKLLSGEKS